MWLRRISAGNGNRRKRYPCFIERLNLTIRQASADWRRHSPCHARGADPIRRYVEPVRCHYNFVRPPRGLLFGRGIRMTAMQGGLVSARLALTDNCAACGVTRHVLVTLVLFQ